MGSFLLILFLIGIGYLGILNAVEFLWNSYKEGSSLLFGDWRIS